ncbi:MAG: TAT-variant-translocated molybdopterin oxidoreductase, partial [Calditrichota bacterium]
MSFEIKGQGKTYWRSLNDLAGTEEFQEFMHREFPEGASELPKSMDRRKFLSLMGASIALAGLVSCRKPVEKIIPYVHPPEEVIPGIPNYYATVMPFQNSAYGVVVESHEGRPTKIEGNELHPASLGKANTFMQAATLNLYDPDRSGQVLRKGAQREYSDLVAAWRGLYPQYLDSQGEGLAVISGAFSSPTLERLRDQFLQNFPKARWVVYEPVSEENRMDGIQAATGGRYFPVYQYQQAKVVLSLDADFIQQEQENVVNARRFADGRRVTSSKDDMNRLYVVEGRFSATGGMADHRLRVRTGRIGAFALALGGELQRQGLDIPALPEMVRDSGEFDQPWLRAVAEDLLQNRNQSLVIAGSHQPPALHALVYALNDALGNAGHTVSYRQVQGEAVPDITGLQDLVTAMRSGGVDSLWMLDTNPIYSAPADLEFADAMQQVDHAFHLGSHVDETARRAEWHIPMAHFLESWGDARSVDGTPGVIQPLIAPLFNGYSLPEAFALMATGQEDKAYDIVRATWRSILGESNFEKRWRKVVHDGVYQEQQVNQFTPALQAAAVRALLGEYSPGTGSADTSNLEVLFQASPSVFDGRYANNGWLQELPDTITKLSW